ncbi:MAG: Uma2 family endonuclease [Pyrinomonadaceae bacterium]|jgi:Uma2 family endonuclease|nr:Uma2 family endonuclease [Pyrinomonadaceae bacterium]
MNPKLKIKPISLNSDIFYPETDFQAMAETDKHRDLIIELIETLKIYFANRENVYITGNIMFYYEEGVTEEVVSPDVMIVFGVNNERRRVYKLWEEKVPSVIIEIASHSTFKKDRTDKKELYESLGVKEYFIFNPEYPKTLPSLIAYRLNDDEFELLKIENKRVKSEVLNFELVDKGDWLRLFDIQENRFVPTPNELIDESKNRAEKAEAEIERLKAELEKLKIN